MPAILKKTALKAMVSTRAIYLNIYKTLHFLHIVSLCVVQVCKNK